MRIIFILVAILFFIPGQTQTLGGAAAYNFLKLPATPLLSASGGVNISYRTNEVGLATSNPALLFNELHGQVNTSFNSFPGEIKAYSLSGAYHKSGTNFSGHVYFVDYGSIPQTDAAGNISGEFRPVDFVIQLGGQRTYLDKWSYGAHLKFISSSYQQFKSSAIAADIGVLYSDSSKDITVSLLAKNMGFQTKTFAGEQEDLPFDFEVGMTKRLAKSPFGFSLTAQHLHRFDILYEDTSFNIENNLTPARGFFTKLMNHFVIASHIYLGQNLEATVGYNHLRRTDLNAGTSGNGLNGFSMGLRIKMKKLQVLYARSQYQRNVAYNQFGISLQLDRMIGVGK